MNELTEVRLWLELVLALVCMGAIAAWWRQQQTNRALSDQHIRQQAQLEHQQTLLNDHRMQLQQSQDEVRQQQQDYLRLKEKHDRLQVLLSEKQSQYQQQLALLQDSKLQLKQEFENLANQILQQKGEQFARQSQQSLLQLLHPLQADMKGFRDKVESIHTEDLKQRSELKTELLNLQKLNSAITDQAARLTSALPGR